MLTALGLGIDAVVHWRLAASQPPSPSGLSQVTLFRAAAVAAAVLGTLVLVLPWRRVAYAGAFLVAASAFGAVMLYRYVDVGALGPLPNMYEPIWFAQKSLSALAEGMATVSALAGLLLSRRPASARLAAGVGAACRS